MCSTPGGGLVARPPSLIAEGNVGADEDFHASFRHNNENVERLQRQRLQAFSAQEPEYQQQIEIEKIRCPAHLIELNRALSQLPRKQTLKVSSRSASLISDLAASARIQHYQTKSLKLRQQHFLYISPDFNLAGRQ